MRTSYYYDAGAGVSLADPVFGLRQERAIGPANNHAVALYNCYYSEKDRAVVTRYGTARHNSTKVHANAQGPLTGFGVWQFHSSDETQRQKICMAYLNSSDSKYYLAIEDEDEANKWQTPTDSTTTDSGLWGFAQGMVNGYASCAFTHIKEKPFVLSTDTGSGYSRTAYTQLSGANSPTGARYAAFFMNRLWLGYVNNGTIYLSNRLQCTNDGTLDTWTATEIYDLTMPTGAEITGLVPWGAFMYVGTTAGWYVLSGTGSVEDTEVHEIDRITSGPYAPYSICRSGDYIYYFSVQGDDGIGVYRMDGSQDQCVSGPIKNRLEDIPAGMRDNVAIGYCDGKLFVSISQGSETANSECWMMDSKGRWSGQHTEPTARIYATCTEGAHADKLFYAKDGSGTAEYTATYSGDVTDDANFNNSDTTNTGASPGAGYLNSLAVIMRSVMKWDALGDGTIPTTATVTAARVRLYCDYVEPGLVAHTLGLYRLTQSFTEASVDWDTYDGTNDWPGGAGAGSDIDDTLATLSVAADQGEGWITLEFSSAGCSSLQEIIDGTESNNGFLLKVASEVVKTRMEYTGSEETPAANRPEIEVEYTYTGTAGEVYPYEGWQRARYQDEDESGNDFDFTCYREDPWVHENSPDRWKKYLRASVEGKSVTDLWTLDTYKADELDFETTAQSDVMSISTAAATTTDFRHEVDFPHDHTGRMMKTKISWANAYETHLRGYSYDYTLYPKGARGA